MHEHSSQNLICSIRERHFVRPSRAPCNSAPGRLEYGIRMCLAAVHAMFSVVVPSPLTASGLASSLASSNHEASISQAVSP